MWQVEFDEGTVEPCSSGSPLYNMDHRIIGQAKGRHNSPTNDWCALRRTHYGRFHMSWTGGGTNATRLSNWLDPTSTNNMTSNTTNVSNLIFSINGPSQFCSSGNYTVNNLPSGATVQWYVNQPSGGISYSVSGNTLTVTRNWDVDIVIDATVSSVCGFEFEEINKSVRVGGDPIQISFINQACNEFQLNVTGAGSNATYNWSSLNNDILYNGTSTTATTSVGQISVTATSGFAIVQTQNTCNQTVEVGDALTFHERAIVGLYPEYIYNDHINVQVNTTTHDTYYRWYVNNVLVSDGSTLSYYCSCTTHPPDDPRVCGDNTVRVEVDTDCGTFSSGDQPFFIICGYRMQSNIELLPNPAKSYVTIRIKQEPNKMIAKNLTDIREIRILDKMGVIKMIKKYPLKSSVVTLDISNLPEDIYFITVFDGMNNSTGLQLRVVK